MIWNISRFKKILIIVLVFFVMTIFYKPIEEIVLISNNQRTVNFLVQNLSDSKKEILISSSKKPYEDQKIMIELIEKYHLDLFNYL